MEKKKNGRFENKNIRNGFPKIKSSGGKYLSEDDKTKKRSQKAQEKVEAAKVVLEKEKVTFKELSTASVDILTGTVMRPVHKKLEELQAIFEGKMKELQEAYNVKNEELFGDIIQYSKNTNSSIKAVLDRELQGIENYESRIEKSIKSSDLDDRVALKTIKMAIRTYTGMYSARLAKMPYTLAARYQTLKGNEEKKDELLFKATGYARRIIERTQLKNRKDARFTEEIIAKFNEVDDATEHYKERESRVKEADKDTQKYVEENSKEDKRKISTKFSEVGRKRIFVANKVAMKVEDGGNWLARQAAMGGHFKLADKAAQKTVEASDYIINKAAQRNKKLYDKTEPIALATEISKRAIKGINVTEFESQLATNTWASIKGNSLKTKGLKLANKAVTSTTKFFAINDMRITEFYAKAMINLGKNEQGLDVLKNAEKRTNLAMDRAKEINTNLRYNFGFSRKRAKTIEQFKSFVDALEIGVSSGAVKNLEGDASDWIESIENNKRQQNVKRRFTRTNKKTNVLSLLGKRSKNILDNLYETTYGQRSARVAAQIDLDMNPEKTKSKKKTGQTSREDRE